MKSRLPHTRVGAVAIGRVRAARRALLAGSRRAFIAVARTTYSRSLAWIADRSELGEVLNRRTLLGVGVEVGVKQGEFSEHVLQHWHGRRLISIDAWSSITDAALSQAEHDALHHEAVRRLAPFGPRSEIRREQSVIAAGQLARQTLDFVYIDASHDYDSAKADIDAWVERIHPGGLLMGHDYYDGFRHGQPYGVRRAVMEFCQARGLPHSVTLFDDPEASWIVVVPH